MRMPGSESNEAQKAKCTHWQDHSLMIHRKTLKNNEWFRHCCFLSDLCWKFFLLSHAITLDRESIFSLQSKAKTDDGFGVMIVLPRVLWALLLSCCPHGTLWNLHTQSWDYSTDEISLCTSEAKGPNLRNQVPAWKRSTFLCPQWLEQANLIPQVIHATTLRCNHHEQMQLMQNLQFRKITRSIMVIFSWIRCCSCSWCKLSCQHHIGRVLAAVDRERSSRKISLLYKRGCLWYKGNIGKSIYLFHLTIA